MRSLLPAVLALLVSSFAAMGCGSGGTGESQDAGDPPSCNCAVDPSCETCPDAASNPVVDAGGSTDAVGMADADDIVPEPDAGVSTGDPDAGSTTGDSDAGTEPETCASSGLSCGDHGGCVDGASGPSCACDQGYTGTTCNACATGYFAVGGACLSAQQVGTIVDDIANDELVRQNIVGLAVGVVLNSQMAYANGYGHADWESGSAVTKATLFRWASLSKPLTAVTAMHLWQDGHLDLDADIRTYMPSWPIKPQGAITMRHLLTNTSGVGHYGDINYNQSAYDPTQPYNPDKTIDVFKNEPLGFTPGSNYRYSTFGFNLASAVIDYIARDAYGASSGYPELVASRVANPLGMSTLRPDYSEFQTITPRVAGYTQTCSQRINREATTDVSWKLGGGGWISSVEDLTRFAQGLLAKQVLAPTTLNMMWSQQEDSSGTLRGYGFGFSTNTTNPTGANARAWHSGAQQNTKTYILLYPGQGLGITVMINSTYADPVRIARRVANAFGRNWTIGEHSMYAQLGCASCSSSESYFSGVWSAGTTPTVIRRGYTHSGFFQEWQRMGQLGWVATDFETYTDTLGTRRWDGVFKKLSGASAMWRGFDFAGFTTKWQEMKASGYQLVDLETYVQSGTRRWAGLFRPGSSDHHLVRDLTHSQFHDKWVELSGAGYRLVDVETYEVSGQRRWAGVFHLGSGGYALVRNLDTAAFGTKRSELHGQGLRLIDVESYTAGGQQLWTGVFRAGTYGQTLNRNFNYCGFLDKHETWAGQGLELVDLEHHD